jgi:hypothetical protein
MRGERSRLCCSDRIHLEATRRYRQSSLERVEDILLLICGLKVLLLFESSVVFSQDGLRGLDGWALLVEGIVVTRDLHLRIRQPTILCTMDTILYH